MLSGQEMEASWSDACFKEQVAGQEFEVCSAQGLGCPAEHCEQGQPLFWDVTE